MSDDPDDARLYGGEDDADEPGVGAYAPPAASDDRKAIRKQQKALAEKNKRLAETAKAIMSQESGRLFLAWMLYEVCALNKPTVAPDFRPDTAMFLAGQRNVGVRLHGMLLQADRIGYMVLANEHMD